MFDALLVSHLVYNHVISARVSGIQREERRETGGDAH